MKKKKRRRRLCNGSVNVRNKSVTSLLIWFHYGREISGFSSDLRRSEGEKKKKKKWWQTDLTCIIWIWIRIYIYIYIYMLLNCKKVKENEWKRRSQQWTRYLNSEDGSWFRISQLSRLWWRSIEWIITASTYLLCVCTFQLLYRIKKKTKTYG